MKILFSLTYYHPYISGLTICVKRLAEGLAARGSSVTVLCMRHDPTLAQSEMIAGVRVVRANVWRQVSKGYLSISWIRQSFHAVAQADVVVVNLPQPEGIVPALCAQILRKKLVVIYHCELVLPRSLFHSVLQWGIDSVHTIILLLANRIVCYTEDYARHSRLLPFFLKKCEFIYPPIIKPNIDKRIQKNIKEKCGKMASYCLGIAARLAAEKGIEYVLEALPALHKQGTIKLLIAGPLDPVGEESYKKKIMALVKQHADTVVFLGSIPQEAMGAFYSLLDILVVPSINATEAFGMVQAEAMAYGIPVVATDLPGVRVPVQVTGMGKIVPVKNSRALAQAIEEILRHPDSVAPTVNVAQIFSVEESIARYQRVLKEQVGV